MLRSGAAEKTFRLLAQHGLLEAITPELHRRGPRIRSGSRSPSSIAIASGSRAFPPGLTNPILLGTLLVPLGLMPRRDSQIRESAADYADDADASIWRRRTGATTTRTRIRAGTRLRGAPSRSAPFRRGRRGPKEPPLRIGLLPVARRDTERLRQILSVQRRLMDLETLAAREAGADAPRTVRGSAGVAGNSRPLAGSARALARIHRGDRDLAFVRRSAGERGRRPATQRAAAAGAVAAADGGSTARSGRGTAEPCTFGLRSIRSFARTRA